MRALGIVLIVLGVLLCITILFAGIGILLIIIGVILAAAGSPRRVHITNVMHVANLLNPTRGAPRTGPASTARGARWDSEDVVRAPDDRLALTLESDLFHEDERHFLDPRSELSSAARRILMKARTAGYEVKTRADAVVVRKNSDERLFFSNAAILVSARRPDSPRSDVRAHPDDPIRVMTGKILGAQTASLKVCLP